MQTSQLTENVDLVSLTFGLAQQVGSAAVEISGVGSRRWRYDHGAVGVGDDDACAKTSKKMREAASVQVNGNCFLQLAGHV